MCVGVRCIQGLAVVSAGRDNALSIAATFSMRLLGCPEGNTSWRVLCVRMPGPSFLFLFLFLFLSVQSSFFVFIVLRVVVDNSLRSYSSFCMSFDSSMRKFVEKCDAKI